MAMGSSVNSLVKGIQFDSVLFLQCPFHFIYDKKTMIKTIDTSFYSDRMGKTLTMLTLWHLAIIGQPRSCDGEFQVFERMIVIPGLTFRQGLIEYRIETGRLVQGENACFTRRKSEVQIL